MQRARRSTNGLQKGRASSMWPWAGGPHSPDHPCSGESPHQLGRIVASAKLPGRHLFSRPLPSQAIGDEDCSRLVVCHTKNANSKHFENRLPRHYFLRSPRSDSCSTPCRRPARRTLKGGRPFPAQPIKPACVTFHCNFVSRIPTGVLCRPVTSFCGVAWCTPSCFEQHTELLRTTHRERSGTSLPLPAAPCGQVDPMLFQPLAYSTDCKFSKRRSDGAKSICPMRRSMGTEAFGLAPRPTHTCPV
jgi:hypothetical protein